MTAPAVASVLGVMDRYFDGLYRADSSLLRPVFHPDLLYVNATTGHHLTLSLDAYLDEIDQRKSPLERGEVRDFRVAEINLVNDQVATVRASCAMLGRGYEDALTLVATERGWQVIAKVFTFEEQGAKSCPT